MSHRSRCGSARTDDREEEYHSAGLESEARRRQQAEEEATHLQRRVSFLLADRRFLVEENLGLRRHLAPGGAG